MLRVGNGCDAIAGTIAACWDSRAVRWDLPGAMGQSRAESSSPAGFDSPVEGGDSETFDIAGTHQLCVCAVLNRVVVKRAR
jgi:hypothetical protein